MSVIILVLLLAGQVALCQDCSHSTIPSEASKEDDQIELILNCSSNYPTVEAIFRIGDLQEYTILYTCTHEDLLEPIQGTAILGGIINRTESLSQSILCDSLCTFGGCYQSGSIFNIMRRGISPLHSCRVCHKEESGTCHKNQSCEEQFQDRRCMPTQDLGSGLVNCNCCTTDDVDFTSYTSPTTAFNEKCTCNCTAFHEGYSCNCQNDYDVHCANISMCNLNYCDDEGILCEGLESYRCLCDDEGAQNCTDHTESHAPINIILTSVLAVAVIIISCVAVSLLLISFTSKNVHRKERDTIDLQISNENYSIDPVDVVVPKHILCKSRSASFSSLCHPIQSILSHHGSKISISERSNPYANSESHLSDTEGYVMCGDCTSSSSHETCSDHYEVQDT